MQSNTSSDSLQNVSLLFDTYYVGNNKTVTVMLKFIDSVQQL